MAMSDYPNAHEFAKALNYGHEKEFTYNGETFQVSKKNPVITLIKWNGFTAESQKVYNMIDYQGIAACLMEYKRDIIFDKDGNVINGKLTDEA